MIIGAEVALLIIGLYALIAGKLPTNNKARHVVQGWPARVIGIICLLPIPLAFLVCMGVAMLLVAQGQVVTPDSFFWVGTAIEGSMIVLCLVVVAVLSHVYRTPVEPPQSEEGRA
jgi:hypothetical protein